VSVGAAGAGGGWVSLCGGTCLPAFFQLRDCIGCFLFLAQQIFGLWVCNKELSKTVKKLYINTYKTKHLFYYNIYKKLILCYIELYSFILELIRV